MGDDDFFLLLVEDEPRLRELYTRLLALEGYQVTATENIRGASAWLEKQNFDIVLTDVRLPDGDGVAFVRAIKNRRPQTEVVVITAYGTTQEAVQAVRNGAYDYLLKSEEEAQLIPTLAAAARLVRQNQRRFEVSSKESDTFEALLVGAPGLRAAAAQAQKAARSPLSILLLGETGTGKDRFARAIHCASRRSGDFVALNCAALPKETLESELFGYKKGAFTGAARDKIGLMEAAEGGTFFLDEIGDAPPELQAKLLRALENQSYYKLGDTRLTHIDVRLVAATHRDLKAEALEGRFRMDLYYRLAAFPIIIPPLRERKEDIASLARVFVENFSRKMGIMPPKITEQWLNRLSAYTWPGNARELKNVVERAVVLCDDGRLTEDPFPPDSQSDGPEAELLYDVERAEKEQIEKALRHTAGRRNEASELLGMGVATLYRKIKKYNIKV